MGGRNAARHRDLLMRFAAAEGAAQLRRMGQCVSGAVPRQAMDSARRSFFPVRATATPRDGAAMACRATTRTRRKESHTCAQREEGEREVGLCGGASTAEVPRAIAAECSSARETKRSGSSRPRGSRRRKDTSVRASGG
ncbi:hypothetical protein ERJ75_001489400 [Trypanosoma vivax]|nr:hypothetical protein ERJ75_001489400 [Trypanosoma vivax]